MSLLLLLLLQLLLTNPLGACGHHAEISSQHRRERTLILSCRRSCGRRRLRSDRAVVRERRRGGRLAHGELAR